MTTLTTLQIATLTAQVTGDAQPKRAANKEAAIKRFSNALDAAGIEPSRRRLIVTDVLNASDFPGASAILRAFLATKPDAAAENTVDTSGLAEAAAESDAEDAAAEWADKEAARRAGRRATLRVIEGTAAAEKPKRASKAELDHLFTNPRAVTPRPGLAETIRVKPGEKVREDGLPEGGIDAKLVDAVLADGGALHSELNAMTGWKKSDRRLARAAQVAGVSLTMKREGNDVRFIGKREARKTA
jgi:hypothetical protein